MAEFCAKTTEPSPHDILLTCLQRNFGMDDLNITYQGNKLKHQKNEFTMTVGKHTATVICKNKRDGKQRASQAILQVRTRKVETDQSFGFSIDYLNADFGRLLVGMDSSLMLDE